MGKSPFTVTGLKPVIDLDGFRSVFARFGLTEETRGRDLLDGYFRILFDGPAQREIVHWCPSWHNLAFYCGRFGQAYDLQYIGAARSLLMSGWIGKEPDDLEDFVRNGKEQIASSRWPICPQLETLSPSRAMAPIEEVYSELEEPKDKQWLRRVMGAGIDGVLVNGSVEIEAYWKRYLADAEPYRKHRSLVTHWQRDIVLSILGDEQDFDEPARLCAAVCALYGLFWHSLVDDEWEDFDSLADIRVWTDFGNLTAGECRKAFRRLENKGFPSRSPVAPEIFALLNLWRGTKRSGGSHRAKILPELNRILQAWIKKTCINDGVADNCNIFWEPFIMKYLVMADLGIDTEESNRFFSTFQEIGGAVPAGRRAMERNGLLDIPQPPIVPIEEIAVHAYAALLKRNRDLDLRFGVQTKGSSSKIPLGSGSDSSGETAHAGVSKSPPDRKPAGLSPGISVTSHSWSFYTIPQERLAVFGGTGSGRPTEILEVLEELEDDLEDFDQSLSREAREALRESPRDLAKRILKTCLKDGLDYARYRDEREKRMLDWLINGMGEWSDQLDTGGGDEETETDPLRFGQLLEVCGPVESAAKPEEWPPLIDFPEIRALDRYRKQYEYFLAAESRDLRQLKWFLSDGRRLGSELTGCRYVLLRGEEIGEFLAELEPLTAAARESGMESLAEHFGEVLIPLLEDAIAGREAVLATV